jgi:hypothetical protein
MARNTDGLPMVVRARRTSPVDQARDPGLIRRRNVGPGFPIWQGRRHLRRRDGQKPPHCGYVGGVSSPTRTDLKRRWPHHVALRAERVRGIMNGD